jgi:hypothetical protein
VNGTNYEVPNKLELHPGNIGHTSSPCGTPEKAEGTWDDNGRDGLTNSKDLRVNNGPEMRKTVCCGKNLKKNLLTYRAHTSYALL